MNYQETAYQKTNIVDANGNVISSFGGGGDASAAKQQSQIELETQIRDRLNSSTPFAVTGSGGAIATEATLVQVRDAIKAQIDFNTSLFTDNSGAYFVRRESVLEGTGVFTTTYTNLLGTVVTPDATTLRPIASADKDILTAFYDVNTSGTGYSIGDLLVRIAILDVNSGTPSVAVIWLNLTTGAILSSAPTGANIERADENIGARQIGNWSVVTTTIDTSITGNITTADLVSTTLIGANNQSIITGNPTANSWVSISGNGYNSFLVQVTGTWSGTLQFETSFDSGTTWYPSSGFAVGTSYTVNSTTSNGAFRGNATDATNIRVRATSGITGTANIRIVLSQTIDPITVRNPIRLFDSVSGAQAAIKAANTLATANDPALVVTNRESGGFISSATIQRAANTTPYTAGDVYGAAVEIANIAGTGNTNILLTSVDITFNISALPSGMGAFTLFLYSVTPPSAVADNGAFSLPSGDRASILTPVGVFLGSAILATGGGSVVLAIDNLNLQFKPTSTSLFGYLVTNGAFTPANPSETATIRVRVLVA